MRRRRFLQKTGWIAAGGGLGLAASGASRLSGARASAASSEGSTTDGGDDARTRVAFVISEGATVIDFAGPWEVFQDVMLERDGEHVHPFELYTVSDRPEALRASAGMLVVPNHTLPDAPDPDVVVVGAQRSSPAIDEWIVERAGSADLVMSVCTGAFILGRTGLLDGRRATTHHDFFDAFEERFPDVELVRGRRFVESGSVATAGGLTSGIDLALHVVGRRYGSAAAERTADYMEYQGRGWRKPDDAGAGA